MLLCASSRCTGPAPAFPRGHRGARHQCSSQEPGPLLQHWIPGCGLPHMPMTPPPPGQKPGCTVAGAPVSSEADGALAGELAPGAGLTGGVGVTPVRADVARVLQGVRGAFCEDRDSNLRRATGSASTEGGAGPRPAEPRGPHRAATGQQPEQALPPRHLPSQYLRLATGGKEILP